MERLGRIVIIGSGNVATHLAVALDAHADVAQVMSRDIDHARRLASRLHSAEAVDDYSHIITDADIYIISVNDDSIAKVATATSGDGLWLHTSGSVGIEALAGSKKRYGVLYPLQTFSREVDIDMKRVPFFIEGSSASVTDEIERIALTLSPTAIRAGSDQRRNLHIAAVLACNFTNHLWTLADDLLHRQGMDFTLLEPLVRATVDKAFTVTPAKGQTGPASRGDRKIVEAHAAALPPDEAQIYRLLSKSIMKHHEQN